MPDLLKQMETYNKDHCWQYDIRLNNLKEDKANHNIDDHSAIRVSDFKYKLIEDKKEQMFLTEFIKRHEWLGTISLYTTHWFAAYYIREGKEDTLAGVILMNMPNAFSKVVGDDTRKIERLVSRGACISWSPKNLASNFLMWSIRHMVANTKYRVFSAYSDPTAKEIGTIYQACNWSYMGQKSGSTKKYISPYSGNLISDRTFRMRSFYKRYAQDLNIPWDKQWNSDGKMHWDLMPEGIELQLRDYGRKMQKEAKCHLFPPKHKYVYVLGKDKRETRQLMEEFHKRNKLLPYPKNRGN